MEIPFRQLAPETLHDVIEEFVTRDGTDYGAREISLQAKIDDVMRQLERGKIKLYFDPETETCTFREAET